MKPFVYLVCCLALLSTLLWGSTTAQTQLTDVIIHFWSWEKCLLADVRINGRDYGTKPVPCRIKLAITQAPSAIDAETRLRDSAFNSMDGDFVPIDVGDKAYLWQGSIVIFIKGRFTFTLSGGADLKVGDFSISREFIEKLAQDISTSVTAR